MITETTRALIKLFKGLEPNTHLSAGSIVELAELPAIVLSGPVATEKKRLMRDPDRIVAYDYENGVAVKEIPPRWYDLTFNAAFSCKSTLELVELMERCSRLAQSHKLLTAEGEERTRQYLWAWQRPPSVYNVPNVSEVCEGRGDLIVYDVEVYSDIRETVPMITKVSLELKAKNLYEPTSFDDTTNEE